MNACMHLIIIMWMNACMHLIISTGCIIDGRYLELWTIIICFCRLVGHSLLRWSSLFLGCVVNPLLFAPPNFILAIAMVAIKGDCKWGVVGGCGHTCGRLLYFTLYMLMYVYDSFLFFFCLFLCLSVSLPLSLSLPLLLSLSLSQLRILIPFYDVSFPDFWIADQLNSLAIVLLDMEYFICYLVYGQNATTGKKTNLQKTNFYLFHFRFFLSFPLSPSLSSESLAKCGIIYYTVRPLVAVLPAWWRFAQCVRRYIRTREAFPHLVNAGKYSTAFFVVTFSTIATFLKGTEREREGQR